MNRSRWLAVATSDVHPHHHFCQFPSSDKRATAESRAGPPSPAPLSAAAMAGPHAPAEPRPCSQTQAPPSTEGWVAPSDGTTPTRGAREPQRLLRGHCPASSPSQAFQAGKPCSPNSHQQGTRSRSELCHVVGSAADTRCDWCL